ncbi:MAG: Holliday junction resolvase RecU [Anaerotignaceae bacterium]
MGYWNSRGLRGSGLEEMINFTNDLYRQKGIAVVQKIPTPITPVEVDNKKRTITMAYFDGQSTVDYIGMAQGVGLCFDAKETSQKSLPIQNIHEHQVGFMEDFIKNGGVAFWLVHFSALGKYYFLPHIVLKTYWENAKKGGRKSIPVSAFEEKFEIFTKGNGLLNYLEAVNTYLVSKVH